MSLMETFSLAIKNISGSKTRTFLTMLGIIIGVCAVIVIVGLGNGMAGYMEDSFAEMGTNTLTVSIMGRGTSRTVSEEQMYQIVEDNADYLDQISPTVSMTGSVKIGSSTYSSTSVSGVGETWFEMKGYEIAQGRGVYGHCQPEKGVRSRQLCGTDLLWRGCRGTESEGGRHYIFHCGRYGPGGGGDGGGWHG